MKYVADTLGVKIVTKSWDNEKKLPYYFANHYKFSKVSFDGLPCILMEPRGELLTITAIKKQIIRIQDVEPYPVVLNLTVMTARQRQSLIKAQIPFIAPPCHIYLPFLGIALVGRFTSLDHPKETLMPASQLLLFYYLYQAKSELRTGETSQMFGISTMQISRAVRQLISLRLVNDRKDGVRIIIYSKESRNDLFERAKPHLLNPVRKKLYVDYKKLTSGLPLAGYSALSELTMLGKPSIDTYAYHGKVGEIDGLDTLIDYNEQAEVEVWQYNPTVLSRKPGIVDTLSLVVSLLHDDDPRVEQSIDELLSEIWR